MKIPSSMRFQIVAINDLCIDIGLAGTYEAHVHLPVSHRLFALDVTTMPAGKRHGDPEAVSLRCDMNAITQPGWGGMHDPDEAIEYCRNQLEGIIEHLEQLQADSQEGAPQ